MIMTIMMSEQITAENLEINLENYASYNPKRIEFCLQCFVIILLRVVTFAKKAGGFACGSLKTNSVSYIHKSIKSSPAAL